MRELKIEINKCTEAEHTEFSDIRRDLREGYEEYLEEIASNPALAAKYEEELREKRLSKWKRVKPQKS